jgi:Tol biopolymer transport system component
MRTTRARTLVGAVLSGLVLFGSGAPPAHATFPGTNGRIAFLLDHHGTDIYSMNPDGSDVRRLTHFAPEHSAGNENWSPDGSLIVFERTNGGRQHKIWLMEADGSDQHLLFPDPWFEDHTPSFSPDGTKVLFSRCQPDFGGEHRCAVTTVNADGTGMRTLTTPAAEEKVFWPVYSPDGSQIAFSVFYGRGVIAGIFVMDADGSNIHLVTPAKLRAWIPSWAPDGSGLAFTTHCCDGKSQAAWFVHPDGTGLKQLIDPGRRHDFQPVYSPDGTHIALERDNSDYSRWGLFVMNVDGTGAVRVLPWAFGAAWQPIP